MDDSTVKQQLVRQYLAAMAMLRNAIEACPSDLWFDEKYTNPFWRSAYHVVFFTHFYVHASEEDFRPWLRHQQNSNYLGPRSEVPDDSAAITPYTREDVLEYWDLCRDQVAQRVSQDNLEASSGFPWLPFNRFELHLYNLRHLAHHTGQLADRLRVVAHVGVKWVRQG